MRIKTLLPMALAGLLMVLVAPLASAERVKTTRATKVMKRPGEQSAVVTRVKSGRTLTVIAKQGRWMKVRVNGRTGWVARSTVQTVNARETPRNTRRRPFVDGRSTRRGWGGDAPDDRVGGDAVSDDDEDADDEDDDEQVAKAKKPKKAKAKSKARAKKSRDADDDDEDMDADDEDLDDEDEDGDEEVAEEEAPQERVVMVAIAKAKIYAKPKAKGKARARVKKGAKLIVLEEKNGWMMVEDPQEGDTGWIKSDEVWEAGARPQRAFGADARLGFARLSQVFRSTGTGALADYDLQAASAAINLRGSMIQKYGKQYLIGGELAYAGGKSAPGIRYSDGVNAVDIPFVTHDIDLRFVGGYDLKNKMSAVLWGRVGYHYGMFQVANVADFEQNLARIPSENLTGATIGVGAEAPRASEKIGVRFAADYLAMGKRVQTVGLEDGAVSTVKALWAGAVVSYQWKKDTTLDAAYNYTWSKTTWDGVAAGSMRGHAADAAARKDVTHGLLVGLAKSF